MARRATPNGKASLPAPNSMIPSALLSISPKHLHPDTANDAIRVVTPARRQSSCGALIQRTPFKPSQARHKNVRCRSNLVRRRRPRRALISLSGGLFLDAAEDIFMRIRSTAPFAKSQSRPASFKPWRHRRNRRFSGDGGAATSVFSTVLRVFLDASNDIFIRTPKTRDSRM